MCLIIDVPVIKSISAFCCILRRRLENCFSPSLLLMSDSYSGSFDSTILDALRVFGAVFNGVGSISVSSTERAGVSSKDRTGHFPIRILQVVRSVKTLAFSIISAENTHLENEFTC